MNGSIIRQILEYRPERWRDFFAAFEPSENMRSERGPGAGRDAAPINANPIKKPDPVLCPACPISRRKDYKGFHMCAAVGCIVAAPISPDERHRPQSRVWGVFIKVNGTPDHGRNANNKEESSAEPILDVECIPDEDVWAQGSVHN